MRKPTTCRTRSRFGIGCASLLFVTACGEPDSGTLSGAGFGGTTPQATGGQAGSAGASAGNGAGGAASAAAGLGGGSTISGTPNGGAPSAGGSAGNAGGSAGEGGGLSAAGSAGSESKDPLAVGGPSKCPLAGSMLCDGFEGPGPGEMGSLFKLEVGSGSSAVVDATKVFRGAKSVHLKTGGEQAFITETSTFKGNSAASNNELWGRIWIWFQTSAAPNGHDVFIRLEDPQSNLSSAQLHVAGGSRGQLAAEIRSGSDLYRPKIIDPRPTTPPPGVVMFPLEQPKWQCWEWHSTEANTLDFYIDGERYEKMSVTTADKWPFPIFKKLYLGFMQFGSTPVTELWLDEVALSTERIGCGN